MDHMTMREEILKKARSMPQMPMAVQQIMRLMQDENADVGKLSKAIEFDAGLTVNILGIANSPYFGGLRKMNTVREAVVRLGSKKVFQMVLAVGVVPFTKKANKGYGLEPGRTHGPFHLRGSGIGNDRQGGGHYPSPPIPSLPACW